MSLVHAPVSDNQTVHHGVQINAHSPDVDGVNSHLQSMTESTRRKQPNKAAIDSNGEVPLRRSSLPTRNNGRRTVKVQNITDFLQCLSIASTNSMESEVGKKMVADDFDSENDTLLGAKAPDVRLKNTDSLQYEMHQYDENNQEKDNLEKESLYRKQVELEIRTEMLRANVYSG